MHAPIAVDVLSWCSGYHIRLTRGRSPVQSWTIIFVLIFNKNPTRCGLKSFGRYLSSDCSKSTETKRDRQISKSFVDCASHSSKQLTSQRSILDARRRRRFFLKPGKTKEKMEFEEKVTKSGPLQRR